MTMAGATIPKGARGTRPAEKTGARDHAKASTTQQSELLSMLTAASNVDNQHAP